MIPTLMDTVRARTLCALFLSLAAFSLGTAFPVLAKEAQPAATNKAVALPADPAIRMGELPNGMRYWIRPNQTPPGKVYVWLRINSGSLNEEDHQRGLAHFLEHMAFLGSEHFPGDAITKRFERLGMQMGRHQNASTGFSETLYTLSLPDNRADTIELAMLALSDIASGLTISPQAVERERNVILEETRASKGAGERIFNRMLPLVLPDSRTMTRLPIGKEDVIRKASATDLKDYYRKWYRPDNAVLMVAGDFETAAIQKSVAKHFSAWKPVDNAPLNARDDFKPYDRVRAAVLTDPEITDADVMFVNIKRSIDKMTTDDLRSQITADLGTAIVSRRLQRMINAGHTSATSAGVETVSQSRGIQAVLASASGPPERWKTILGSLVSALHRAQAQGFEEQEIDDERRDILASLEHDVASEPTRKSSSYMNLMNSVQETGSPPITVTQRLALYRELLATIRAPEVSESFRNDFSPENRLFLVTLPDRKSLPVPTEAEILAVAQTAQSGKVAAVGTPTHVGSFLEQDPVSGRIARQRKDPDTRAISSTLANGVHLFVRQMDEEKEKVKVVVNLADGEIRETAKNRGISAVAQLALFYPSTDKFSPSDIEDMRIGRKFYVIGYGSRGLTQIHISSTPAELEDALRLAHLLLTRARIDKERFRIWREDILLGIERRQFSASSQLTIRLNDYFAGGDPRFMPLQPADIERLTLEAGQAWLDRILRTAPMDVAIVGDIPANQALALGAKYFGSLPRHRDADPTLKPLREIGLKPGALEDRLSVMTETPRAEVYVGWRGTDLRNARHHRALDLAASILSRRLFNEIRTQRGLAYSIGCSSFAADVYPGLGRFGVRFATDPDKSTEAADLVRSMVERFASEGPTVEELDIARKQHFVVLKDWQRDTATWAGYLASQRYFGSGAPLAKNDSDVINALTPESIRTVLRQYIVPERFVRVVGLPAKPKTDIAAARAAGSGNQP